MISTIFSVCSSISTKTYADVLLLKSLFSDEFNFSPANSVGKRKDINHL